MDFQELFNAALGLAVIGLVAGDYQSALATKNALYNQVEIDVDSVVIPERWVAPEEII